MNTKELEIQVAQTALEIIEALTAGRLDTAAKERSVSAAQIAAAAIAEMSRQAYQGEWS